MGVGEQDEIDRLAGERKSKPSGSAEEHIEEVAKEKAEQALQGFFSDAFQQEEKAGFDSQPKLAEELSYQQQIILQLQPRAVQFRRIFRQYIDEGFEFNEAKKYAIQHFKKLQILRDADSNINDYFEFRKKN